LTPGIYLKVVVTGQAVQAGQSWNLKGIVLREKNHNYAYEEAPLKFIKFEFKGRFLTLVFSINQPHLGPLLTV
jgi:hypothetical protein